MQGADSMAKLETVLSQVLPQEEENQYLRHQLSMMEKLQKKCDSLENKNKKLKQKLKNFKSHVKMNMIEYSEFEQYKRVIDKKARQVVKKLEVDRFLQVNLLFFNVLYFISLQVTFWIHTLYAFPLLSLIAICFVDFWNEGGIYLSLKLFSFYHYYC